MHTIQVITRLAWNDRRTGRASASISCEHCRSSRNKLHYAPRHKIYHYVTRKKSMYYTQFVTFWTLKCRKIIFKWEWYLIGHFQCIRAKEAIKEAEKQEMMESCSISSNTDYKSETTVVVENEAIMDNTLLLPNFYVEEYVSNSILCA